MKKFSGIILFFFAINTISSQNIYKKRMNEIYSRIRTTLKQREKQMYLKKPHVVNANFHRYKQNSINGIIRLNNKGLICVKKINNGEYKKVLFPFSKIKIIRIKKWIRKISKRYTRYTRFTFSPDTIQISLKNGKKYLLSSAEKHKLNSFYIFTQGDTITRLYPVFTLYYDRFKKRYYNTTKKLGFYLTHPAPGTVVKIEIKKYAFDKHAKKRKFKITRLPGGGTEMQLRQSESQIYFENERKKRLAREKARRQAEEQRIREEQQQRERERRQRNNRRNNNRTTNR